MRERIVWDRYLPSFEKFLRRQSALDIATTYWPSFNGGSSQDVMACAGTLILDGKNAGFCRQTFFYHGWASEPSSAEFSLTFEPWVQDKLDDGTEFKTLVSQTRNTEGVRATLADMAWFSRYDAVPHPGKRLPATPPIATEDEKKLHVTLQTAYPSKWMEDVPEYDHGFSDELQFVHVHRVLKFLSKNAFASEWPLLSMNVPDFNPPSSTWQEPVGRASGIVRLDDGKIMTFEISTSATMEWHPQVTLFISLGAPNSMTPDEERKLFKPSFLQLKHTSYEGGLSIESMQGEEGQIVIQCPLEYHLETADLSQLKPIRDDSTP